MHYLYLKDSDVMIITGIVIYKILGNIPGNAACSIKYGLILL